MERKSAAAVLGIALGLMPLASAVAAEEGKYDWGALQYLLGDWVGEGGGRPGQGVGAFSFLPDLQDRVLVRKSFATYPATQDRPASRHNDLTIIYRESEGAPLRAIYFDNEGHVIRYAVTASADKGTVEFLSDGTSPGPRFRLTYTRTGTDAVAIRFEIAPPGKPEAFTTYLDASARRK